MGNNYAISVGGVLEALQHGGSTMSAFGLSLQESTALITAANEAIQDPTRVGTGLKSLTSNLAGLKTSARDGTISLNKTGIALKTIAGIDIFTDKSQTKVKSMTTLLDEISSKWGSLTDVQQKALSSGVAGKQQSEVFQSLMKNYDTYKQMMSEYSNGDQFNSALNENAKYINSIQGRMASLKATWTQITTTIFNSDMIKGSVSGLDIFSKGINNVIATIDKMNLGIPAAVASIMLLKTAFSSFKYAESFSAGISLIAMKIASIPSSLASIPATLTAFTGLNVTMLGLIGTVGALAAAYMGLKAIQSYVDDNNTKATRKWKELSKSVIEHKKALDKAEKGETSLNKIFKEYEKLDAITNKSKKEQEEYNKVLNDLTKINPDLVVYDENGSPIKARVGEVQDLIRQYQKAQREQQKLLNRDLKDKADTSFDKYKEEVRKRNELTKQLQEDKEKLLYNTNPSTGVSTSKLDDDWLVKTIAGNTDAIKNTKEYFKNLEEYKNKEKEVFNQLTQQRNNVNKDQSNWLNNLFSTNDDLENAGKNRQKALENALKLDFSQFDKEGMDSLGNKMNEWFSTADYKDMGSFNKKINEVNELNQAWKNGDITSRAYKTSVDDIANTLSKLTGGQISVEEFAKMLKLPEFDVESANKTFSDIEDAQNTLKSKLADMSLAETPKQRLELAYDIIQDEKVPEEIKNKIAEIASDGSITNEELKIILDLIGQINDDDLENTLNEEIDKLSEEKKITQEVAVKYAMKVDSASDNNQYLEELLGDANLAMDIQMHMDTGDLELLKKDLDGIPPEKQVGIIISAINSGKYTPEQLQSFMQLLPTQKQVDIITSLQQSGDMTPEQIKELINGLPPEVQKQITINAEDNASPTINSVDRKKLHDKVVKINAQDNASSVIRGLDLRTVYKYVKIVTKGTTLGVGGSRRNETQSVGNFSNISDTPQQAEMSAMSMNPQPTVTPNIASSSPTGATSNVPNSYASTSSSGEMSTMASVSPIDTVFTTPTKATKISTAYNNIWNTIKYGINLFQELENRIEKVNNNVEILNSKMENATGTKKISYLQQQNKLYKEQASLTNTLYKSLMAEKTALAKKSKTYGFSVNSQGNLTNYDENLLKLEQAAEKAEKKSSDYSGKSDKTKKSLEKAADKAKTKLEEARKVSDAFLKLQNEEIPNARKEWVELQNTIKDVNDEIEQLKLEDRIYKEQHALDELNNSYDQYSNYLDRINTKRQNSTGEKQLSYMKQELGYMTKLMAIENDKISQYSSERRDYKSQLGKYGVKFDDSGQMTNMDDTLNKYKNTSDYDKVKKWMEEYNELSMAQRDTQNSIEDFKNQIQDLNTEIKTLELENSLKSYNNELDKSESKIKSLQNNLDILGIKFENAHGNEKLEILKQQIELQKQLKAEQEKQLGDLNKKEDTLQGELSKNGFKFDNSGNVTNMATALKSLENTDSYEYVKSVLEQWQSVHEDEIPDAVKSIEEYDNAIKDSYNNQLNITKEMEDKITDMLKKQIEDKKKAIEKETETLKSEIEKRKKAYQDERKEAEYKNDYEEKANNVNDLEKQLETARKDSSLGNKKKIADLEKQLEDAKKDLDKFVQDKIDEDVINGYDKEMEAIEEKNNKAIEDLDNTWTEEKLAEAVKNALSTGLFTGIDGEVSNLQESMLTFAETSGEALGVMGQSIKDNLIANLGIALDTLKNYSDIANGLGLTVATPTSTPTTEPSNKSITTGNININIQTKSNADENAIAKAVQVAVEDALKGTVEGL